MAYIRGCEVTKIDFIKQRIGRHYYVSIKAATNDDESKTNMQFVEEQVDFVECRNSGREMW